MVKKRSFLTLEKLRKQTLTLLSNKIRQDCSYQGETLNVPTAF